MGTCVTNKMAFVMVACADCLHSATAAKATNATNRKLRWMAADMSLHAMFRLLGQAGSTPVVQSRGTANPERLQHFRGQCVQLRGNNVRRRDIVCVRNTRRFASAGLG